jgi:hypothetical protein
VRPNGRSYVALMVDGSNKEHVLTGKSDDVAVAKANLVGHLKNIDTCDDARHSAVEKIHRFKGEVEKAQDCLYRFVAIRGGSASPPASPKAPGGSRDTHANLFF